jgi:hypothetical protein
MAQALPLQLQAIRQSINQIALVQDQQDLDASGIRPGATLPGWTLQRLDFASSSFRGWNGDFYPQLEAFIKMRRNPANQVPLIFIPFLLLMLVPTVMSLYIEADIAPRLASWSLAILALVALNFNFSARFPALGSDTFMGELISIGFAYQLSMVVVTTTILNPHFTPLLGEDLRAELVSFLRWSLPLGLLGLLMTRILLIALVG